MNNPAKKAGTASSKLSQWICVKEDTIMQPTMIKAGAVAALGIADTKVARNALNAKQIAVTTDVRPVLPPAPIPAALSTNVVVLDVPKMAPIEVAVASANKALSIFELKPLPDSSVFLILFREDTAASACTDKRTDRIKCIRHAEGKDCNQN